MGAVTRAGLRALWRRFARRPSSAAVREALRGQAGVGTVEAVEVSAAGRGGTLIIVRVRVGDGVDAQEAASLVADVLQRSVPHAELRVDVLARKKEGAAG